MTQDISLNAHLDAWLKRDPDPACRQELATLRDSGRHEELEARFSGRLQFGTAGIRGVVGAGPMRMNRLVIRDTSAGLAAYLLKAIPDAAERGVVVTFDARPDSRQFAEDAASVFLGSGIKVFLTEEAQPTPVGAFAVTELGAAAGVVVTASHNPPEYNGYKVYWENGAQIIPPHDSAIAACIEHAATQAIPWEELESGAGTGRLVQLDEEFIARYQARVSRAIRAWQPDRTADIGVAYTALHGVGAKLARSLINDTGVATFSSVPSQHEPDGSFPTVAFPNPEEPGAMDAVIDLAASQGATLACANDPDADRLAVAVRTETGSYDMLSGDQVGILLGEYCLSRTEPQKQIVCASLVSSRMLGNIAQSAGATYFETLTGFKWLSNIALQNETAGRQFLFAYEEALGYALGQVVRDKDGLSALALFAQMTAALAAEGLTVIDRLEALYREHGLFLTEQRSLKTSPDSPSITGVLRDAVPRSIAGIDIVSTKDLLTRRHIFADGQEHELDNYAADVLIYYLADESRVIVRPSGTEPKTKCYYEVIGQFSGDDRFSSIFAATELRLSLLADKHQAELKHHMDQGFANH